MNVRAWFDNYCLKDQTGIWKYQPMLPHVDETCRISLGEGNTPLVKSRAIAQQLGLTSLYFKLEGANPTGSYKDRISALGVSRALELGKTALIGTSSGNAGASVAAYAARAGLPYHLYVLEHVLEAKIKQAMLYGAHILKVQGFGTSSSIGERVFSLIKDQGKLHDWEVMITAYLFNPTAMDGVKTIAYEIFEQLGYVHPDAVYVPVGGGGLYVAVNQGFQDLHNKQVISTTPKVVAVQSEGCSNIVRAWQKGMTQPAPGDSTSAISGLQVPNPPDGVQVLDAMVAQGAWGESVRDEEVWMWQEKLASVEGIWCEPASAVSLTGLIQSIEQGRISRDSKIVCILTGAGFKDNERTERIIQKRTAIPMVTIEQLEASSSP